MNYFVLAIFTLAFHLTFFSQERAVAFYFETNASILSGHQKSKFDTFLDTLISSKYKINDVQSFCDNRGSDEYNGELAYKRLLHIKDQLTNIWV